MVNVALIGFMGTGKTVVGHCLASLLKFHMVDTDEMIEHRTGKRIRDIFREEGEPRFREYERETVLELSRCHRTVIAAGGGLAVNPENLASLKTHSLVVCLWASPKVIWRRVRHPGSRPLLDDPDPLRRIRRLLAERQPFYRQADVLVNTNLRSVRVVANQVAYQFRLVRGQLRHEETGPAKGA